LIIEQINQLSRNFSHLKDLLKPIMNIKEIKALSIYENPQISPPKVVQTKKFTFNQGIHAPRPKQPIQNPIHSKPKKTKGNFFYRRKKGVILALNDVGCTSPIHNMSLSRPITADMTKSIEHQFSSIIFRQKI